MDVNIIILGTHLSSKPSRATIGPSLEHAAKNIHCHVNYIWVSGDTVKPQDIRESHGVFIGPGDPRENIEGIIDSILLARTAKIPCLGTCGGFQRMITEYAKNALGFKRISHQETEPEAIDPLFSQMQCSLVGEKTEIEIADNTLAAKIYGLEMVSENFFCKYALRACLQMSSKLAGIHFS